MPVGVPDALVVGAPKSGTTSFAEYLSNHPRVALSSPKETRYFASDSFAPDPAQYVRRFFAGKVAGKVLIDGDPENMFVDYVPERIRLLNSTPKIVAVLREPAARAFSQWWMDYSSGIERLPFDEAIAANIAQIRSGLRAFEGHEATRLYTRHHASRRAGRVEIRTYLDYSHYGRALDRYAAIFGAESLCVVSYEQMAQDPVSTVDRVFDFLGVGPYGAVAPTELNVAIQNVGVARFAFRTVRLVRRLGLGGYIPNTTKNSWWPAIIRTLDRGQRRPSLADYPETAQLIRSLLDSDTDKAARHLPADLREDWQAQIEATRVRGDASPND